MTTPTALYALEPETRTFALYALGPHLPGVDVHGASDANERSQRVEVRILEDHDFDDRRYWRLATVWFDGRPVMIVQNAGREGRDHSKRFITDGGAYAQMVGHLIAITPLDTMFDVIDPDEDRDDLTEFYSARWSPTAPGHSEEEA